MPDRSGEESLAELETDDAELEEASSALAMPKIGKFVEQHVIAIADYCEANPAEFERLQDGVYSKTVLGLNYPFFREPELVDGKYLNKYRKSPPLLVGGKKVLFTNDWYSRHYPVFIGYLKDKRLIDEELAEAFLASVPESNSSLPNKLATSGVLGPLPIGNAQNLLIRNILGRVRSDEMTYGGWESTWVFFGGRCAYCDQSLRKFDRDHVYGINYLGLGEHKRGNLVPSCKDCNKEKSDQDFRVFLEQKHVGVPGEARRRIARIEQFMAERDYAPLPLDPDVDLEQITALLLEARRKMQELADECVAAVKTVLSE